MEVCYGKCTACKKFKNTSQKIQLYPARRKYFLNITRQAYSHYEQALREPDLNTLVHLSRFYQVTLDELIAGNIHADQIRESMPIYKYRHSETVDHIHTLYLTDQEVNLIENFRDASENDRQMLLIFLNRKP